MFWIKLLETYALRLFDLMSQNGASMKLSVSKPRKGSSGGRISSVHRASPPVPLECAVALWRVGITQ